MAYGAVDRQTWNDEKFRSWDRDTRDVWLYLLTCPHANRVGCFVLDPLYVASDVQIDVERARECLEFLDDQDRIVWDADSRVVCIKRHLHPDYNPLANQSVAKAAAKDVKGLPECPRAMRALASAVDEWGKPHYEPLRKELRQRVSHGGSHGARANDQDQDHEQDQDQDHENAPSGADGLPPTVVPMYEAMPDTVKGLASSGTEPLDEEDRGELVQALLGAWISVQRLEPSEAEKAKQGAVAKRLAEKFSPFRLAVALLGLEALWEHREGGQPWDLFDLERKLSKSVDKGMEVLQEGDRSKADRKVDKKREEIREAMEAVG